MMVVMQGNHIFGFDCMYFLFYNLRYIPLRTVACSQHCSLCTADLGLFSEPTRHTALLSFPLFFISLSLS